MTAAKMKMIRAEGGEVRVFAGGQTVADVDKEAIPAKDIVREPSIIVKSRGHIGFTYYDRPFTHKAELWSYTLTDPDIDQKFVYYYLLTKVDHFQEVARATSVKLPQLGVRDTDSFPIPVPPLEVQREIVRILDHFTELEAELEAELKARRLQYAHYLREASSSMIGARTTLASLGKWVGGITPSKAERRYWEGGSIPWLASMDVSDSRGGEIRGKVTQAALDETSLRIIPAPSVAVVMRSNILRRRLPISLVQLDTTVNQDVRLLVPKDGVHAEFVYYMLRAMESDLRERLVRTDGSMAAVDTQSFLRWPVTLPSSIEQVRMVERFRAFDALVNDLSIGLPAELAARRKQYEYYRDKLLTFEEAPA